jgi:hypothetical protein
MPASYAHMTLVNELFIRLDGDVDFPAEAYSAIGRHLKFCELGAVSPDYPYLALASKSREWADLMHGVHDPMNTLDLIRAGVSRLSGIESDACRHKCLAWLLGYTAHVATDVSVHPVINRKVGPYEDNKTEHRVCEMHQDVFIFRRMNLDMALSGFLERHIGGCADPEDRDRLDPDIAAFWKDILESVFPRHFEANPPEIDKWHEGFNRIMGIANEGGRLLAFARHVAADEGLVYPLPDEDDSQYIEQLGVPGGLLMDYNAVFEKAIVDVRDTWLKVVRAMSGATELAKAGNWSLDSGKDNNNKSVFWSFA